MRSLILLFAVFCTSAIAQVDSLQSNVYRWHDLQVEKSAARERRQILKGSTTDLGSLEIHATTVEPKKSPHASHSHDDTEELIIVKEGKLKVTIKDESQVLGPGSIALALPGDQHGLENAGDTPVTYYVFRYRSKSPVNIERGKNAGGSFMVNWDEVTMQKTETGGRRQHFDRATSMFDRLEMHVSTLNAGLTTHNAHTHRAEEFVLIIKGEVEMQIGEAFHKASAGDLIFLAKEEIAKGLTASVTLGAGQFCTNPGLVFLEASKDAAQFQKLAAANFLEVAAATMLTSRIHQAYENGIEKLGKQEGVAMLAKGRAGEEGLQGVGYLFQTNARNFLANENLEDEVFGPSTLTVTASNKAELIDVAQKLKGHLTATLWATDDDLKEYAELIAILERKTGRLIVNGFPTGVEVCHAMIHGGPFPATTNSRSTSVGTAAITRFTRPICYQNFPDSLLPDELKNANPLGIWRLVNGERKK